MAGEGQEDPMDIEPIVPSCHQKPSSSTQTSNMQLNEELTDNEQQRTEVEKFFLVFTWHPLITDL
jgi:hypothetical protein